MSEGTRVIVIDDDEEDRGEICSELKRGTLWARSAAAYMLFACIHIVVSGCALLLHLAGVSFYPGVATTVLFLGSLVWLAVGWQAYREARIVVRAVGSYPDALRLLAEEGEVEADLLLIDLRLRDLAGDRSGLDLARTALQSTDRLGAFIMTRFEPDSEEVRRLASEAGVDGVLDKRNMHGKWRDLVLSRRTAA